MTYSQWIKQLKNKWIGTEVSFEGKKYTVIDVDYNGALLINKAAQYTDTTAVGINMLDE